MSNNFLPMQLIYVGKTSRSVPTVTFPRSFSISVDPTHYSNEKELLKVMKDIVVPYVEKERVNLNMLL